MGGVVSWIRQEDSAYSFFTVRRDVYVFARSARDCFQLTQAQIERLQKAYFDCIRPHPATYPSSQITTQSLAENDELYETFERISGQEDENDTERLMREHDKQVNDLIKYVMNRLKTPVQTADYLRKVGVAHHKLSHHRINPMFQYYSDAFSALSDSLFELDEDKENWSLIVSFIIGQIKDGYEGAVNKNRRRLSQMPMSPKDQSCSCPKKGKPSNQKHDKKCPVLLKQNGPKHPF